MGCIANMTRATLASHFFLAANLAYLLAVGRVAAYSAGAPPEACYTMWPSHQHPNTQAAIPPLLCGIDEDCSGLSLTVTRSGVSSGHYSCGDEHQVTLESARGFVGYLIQARVPVAGQPFHKYRIVGTMVSPGPGGRTLQCNATADSPSAASQPNSATQNGSTSLNNVTVIWRAPEPFIAQGNIQFYAAVMEDLEHFYLPVTSEVLEPLSPTCENYLPFLTLGTSPGVSTQEVPKIDDWSSDPIPIPGGFPFGTYNHTVVYIGTNGVFSFGYRETGYWHHISTPNRFYAAPFWGDVNLEDGGSILYEIHQAPSLLINQVSTLISKREEVEFAATWMLIAFWKNAQQYGSPSLNGNTFQGVLVTDSRTSFMVSTFRGQSLSWFNSDVRIGYMGDQQHFSFGPQNSVIFDSLFDNSSVLYYNEVYQLSIDGERIALVQPALSDVAISINNTATTVTLQFDLAIDAMSCDTTQFRLQDLVENLTFAPIFKAECAPVIYGYNYNENSGDNIIVFSLHPRDHVRLLGMPYNQIAKSSSARVSVGSTFVLTTGYTGVNPIYFMDMFTASVARGNIVGPTVLAFTLDMVLAEFTVELNSPANVSSLDYFSLSCGPGNSEFYDIKGTLSTTESSQIAQQVSLRISPSHYLDVCYSLPCIEDGFAVLADIPSFQDPFGNLITTDHYLSTNISVIGAQSCSLGVDGLDPALMNHSQSDVPLGPLGLYLRIALTSNENTSMFLYPLHSNEVFLPDCYDDNIVVDSVVCLRLDHRASSPQLTLTSSAETAVAWSNTSFSSTATLPNEVPHGVFSCRSPEGFMVSVETAGGEAYLSTDGLPTSYSIGLGLFWHVNLTIALCPSQYPWDVTLTNDRDLPLVGFSATNNNQDFSIQAGPLYLEDTSNVNVVIPTSQSHVVYRSVFSITIDIPPVRVHTAGSTRGTVAVVLASALVDTALYCLPENEYISVTWFMYTNSSVLEVVDNDVFSVERNGQKLSVKNLTATEFLMASFECLIRSSPNSNSNIPIANFTTVGTHDHIVVSMNHQQLSSGRVLEQFKNNTIFSMSGAPSALVLPCYGAAGHGAVRWQSTVPQFPGYLREDSSSMHYSVQYSGSIATLTVYTDASALSSGSLTCYSEEAGLVDGSSITLHISNGICSCDNSSISPYPLSLCPNASHSPCTCPLGYEGDGVLCALDSDGDRYPDFDTSVFHYCQPLTDDVFCKQDICPYLYNPGQSPLVLENGDLNGVAFQVGGVLLPPSVVIATSNASTLNPIRCLGTEGNVDITVELFGTQHSNTLPQYLQTEICTTEAKILLQVESGFEGAVRCHSGATDQTIWMYFSSDACMCSGGPVGEPPLPDYVRTCERAGIEACDCTGAECECACWHSGDGRVCSVDSDGDTYPDNAASPLCAGNDPAYCSQDDCPLNYDPWNDPRACEEVEVSESVCVSEVDPTWRITWSDTRYGFYDSQKCPGSASDDLYITGVAVRQCNGDGTWSEVIDISCCKDPTIEAVAEEFNEIFEGPISNETMASLSVALGNLVEATAPPDDRSSLFAQDLETTNLILQDTIDFLRDGVKENFLEQLNTDVVQVIDNVLEESNTDGWSQLADTEEGAEQLLDNAELYGSYVTEALASPDIDVDLEKGELVLNTSFNNIRITATVQDPMSVSDVIFPVAEEDFSVEPVFGESLAHIRIPADLLEKRAEESNASAVFTVNMVIENINELLTINGGVTNINGTNYTTRAVTQLIVSQIVVGNGTNSTSSTLGIPVQLVFVTEEIDTLSTNPRCVFYDFDKSDWSEVGVVTESVTQAPDSRSYHVLCTTSHFTSFAVLVDVSDTEMDIPKAEAFALTLVTYIGCGISLFCLLLSILFYISFGKELFTSVHYFVHLNLAVALFLGYAVFVAGINYGTRHRVACGVVAGALHYLFLSVFCWMLCEGIMLYLMLVLVFSKLSKKWWLFLLIGWGLPVIVVAVSVGVQHENYGDPDQGFCWISVRQGLIWAFVGPMLAVIVVNIFFMCAALRSLYRVTAGRFSKGQDKSPLVKKLLMATVILLPLLGVTWAVGLLAVNENTTVFTWLFTIFNSLQGLFFFIFHVIRSDKMWNKIMICLPGERKDKRGRSLSGRGTQSSTLKRDNFLISTLKRKTGKKKKKDRGVSELSSDAVIVLSNPMASESNPFGNKKDEDLCLASTVLL